MPVIPDAAGSAPRAAVAAPRIPARGCRDLPRGECAAACANAASCQAAMSGRPPAKFVVPRPSASGNRTGQTARKSGHIRPATHHARRARPRFPVDIPSGVPPKRPCFRRFCAAESANRASETSPRQAPTDSRLAARFRRAATRKTPESSRSCNRSARCAAGGRAPLSRATPRADSRETGQMARRSGGKFPESTAHTFQDSETRRRFRGRRTRPVRAKARGLRPRCRQLPRCDWRWRES